MLWRERDEIYPTPPKLVVRPSIVLWRERVKNEFEQSTPHVQTQTSSFGDIGQLHDLFKSGAITQDEFDEQKKKILGKAA